MNKTATVKSVQGTGTHTDQYGLKYDWEVEMSNGDVGVYSSNTETQNYFEPGKEVIYVFIPHDKYPKIKRPPKDQQQPTQQRLGTDKVQLFIIRQSSLKAAIDFNNIIMGDDKPTLDDICCDAEHLTNYVMNGLDKSPLGDTVREEPPPPTENDLF